MKRLMEMVMESKHVDTTFYTLFELVLCHHFLPILVVDCQNPFQSVKIADTRDSETNDKALNAGVCCLQ